MRKTIAAAAASAVILSTLLVGSAAAQTQVLIPDTRVDVCAFASVDGLERALGSLSDANIADIFENNRIDPGELRSFNAGLGVIASNTPSQLATIRARVVAVLSQPGRFDALRAQCGTIVLPEPTTVTETPTATPTATLPPATVTLPPANSTTTPTRTTPAPSGYVVPRGSVNTGAP